MDDKFLITTSDKVFVRKDFNSVAAFGPRLHLDFLLKPDGTVKEATADDFIETKRID